MLNWPIGLLCTSYVAHTACGCLVPELTCGVANTLMYIVVTCNHFSHCLGTLLSDMCPLSIKVLCFLSFFRLNFAPCCQTIALECLGVTVLKSCNKSMTRKRAKSLSVPCHKQCLAGYRLRIWNNCSWDHPRKQLLLGICPTHPARHLRSCPRS